MTVLQNFGFLYSLINIRNSFRLKKNPQKMLFVREVIKRKQLCHLNYSNLPLTTPVRRGHVTAKHMCVCVSQNSGDSESWKLSKLSSCEIYECLRKRKKDRVPFLRQSQDQRKGRNHLAVKRQQTSLRTTKVANRIRVISPASLLTWTEFREKGVCFIV